VPELGTLGSVGGLDGKPPDLPDKHGKTPKFDRGWGFLAW